MSGTTPTLLAGAPVTPAARPSGQCPERPRTRTLRNGHVSDVFAATLRRMDEPKASAATHFELGLADLRRQRDVLTRQIEVVESMIEQLRTDGAAPGPTKVAARTGQTTGPWPSVRTITLEIASRTDGEFSLSEVVKEAGRQNNPSQYASISSVVSSMVTEGVLVRGSRRGTYKIKNDDGPTPQGGEAIAQPPE